MKLFPIFFILLITILPETSALKKLETPSIPHINLPNHKWEIYMAHDESYPDRPFETNGPGPAFNENDMRLKEVNQTLPPHPDMPDELPDVFNMMSKKLGDILGMGNMNLDNKTIPSNNSSIEQDFPSSIQFESMIPEQKTAVKMRFSETSTFENSKVSSKSQAKNILNWAHMWQAAPLISAWASSVYTYKWWWWSHSYPATNAIRGWSYWCSTGGHSKEQVIIFQADIDQARRINHLLVHWAYASGEYSVKVSNDGKVWEEKIGWKKGARSWLSSWWYRIFWWWTWWYRSYSENIMFDEPVWIQSFQLLMRDPLFYYFGIYRVYAWQRPYVVQFKNGAVTDEDDCLTIANGQYNLGADIVSSKCIDDIATLDARELFVLHPNLSIQPLMTGLVLDGYSFDFSDKGKLKLWGWNGGANQKWLIDHKGYMKSSYNAEMCVSISGKEIDVQESAIATASSTMNDGQHEAKLAIDGSEGKFWASTPGLTQASFVINFKPMTVKKVTIIFYYVACEFDVMGLIDGSWRSFGLFQANTKKEVEVLTASKTLSGVKILLLKTEAKFNEQLIYGIEEVRINSGARPVNYKKCTDNNGGQNRWFLDDANFVDISVSPRVRAELSILWSFTNRLLDLLNTLVSWPPKIVKMVEKGKELKTRISQLEQDLNDNDMKMSLYRVENLQADENEARESLSGTIGSNSLFPAKTCSAIKRTYSYKKTGYYWIHPKCSRIPMRVFCDFTTNQYGLPYAFYGSLSDVLTGSKVKNLGDVRFECAKLGLEPVQINGGTQLDLINKYLQDIGVNLQTKAVIPIGFDYGCIKGGCKEKYSSLNNEDSKDMTDVFMKRKDSKNILSQGWAKMFNVQKDEAIGFGMSKTGLMTFKFSGNIPVRGVVCSTNSDEHEFETEWVMAECHTTARGNPNFDGIEHTNIKVKCPPGCLNSNNAKVWGVENFKDDSSVCRAAIHNGRIKPEEGGLIEVGIEGAQPSFKGSESNGIKSEDYSSSWDRSFVVNTYVVSCPIDNFQTRSKSSFLEIQELGFLKDDPSGQEGESQGGGNQQQEGQQQEGQGSGQAAPQIKTTAESKLALDSKVETTEDAVKKLEAIFAEDKNSLRKQIRLVSDASTLNKKLAEQFGVLITTDIGPDYQGRYIDSLEMHLIGSLNEMSKLISEAREKLSRKIKKRKELALKKMKLLRFDPYDEEYVMEIHDVYEIQTFKNGYLCPPNWEFTKQNLKGHANAIVQTSSCQINGGPDSKDATHLILKYKRYYDGLITVSFLGRADGRIGILFRYIDQFNYYAFDLQRGTGGFKRLRKFINGVPVNLAVIKDGGFLQDIWYRVAIKFKQGVFKVFMEEENEKNVKPEEYENMNMVLEGYDGDLALGAVGFSVNKMNGAYFDLFHVEGYDCASLDEIKDGSIYTPPRCSRFKESFYAEFNSMWSVVDPVDYKDGPSVWKYKESHLGRTKVIYQSSLIYSTATDKPPSLIELKIPRFCQEGVLLVDFNAKTNGFISVGYHFMNSKNFYSFEIGGSLLKFCQVRKTINGDYKQIFKSSDEKCGYEVNKWYSLMIVMTASKTAVYMAESGEGMTEILRADNDADFKYGKISLGTFKTQAAFSNLKMMPRSDVDIKMKDSQYELNKKGDEDNGNNDADDQDDDKGDDGGGKVAAPGSASNHGNDNTIKDSICLEKRTRDDREKYCLEKFLINVSAKNDCVNNFCLRCCENAADPLHHLQKIKCIKDCQDKSLPDSNIDTWKICSQSPKPAQSVYQYCEVSMKSNYDKQRCKVDMCNLCCVSSDEIFKRVFDENSIKSCKKECMEFS